MVVVARIVKLGNAAPIVVAMDVAVIQITAAKTNKLIFKWFLTRTIIKN